MGRKNNESHIGGEDLFGDAELTAEEKIAAAEADLAEARAEMAEGGAIAGAARVSDDERWRVEGGGDPERKPTANEEVGYLRELRPGTAVDIEDAKRAQVDAAEEARGKRERLARDKLIRAQEAINEGVSGPIKEALRKKHPKRGELNIEASKAHTARDKEWDAIIDLGRAGEPVEPPMKTADTVSEAEARLNEIIAKRDETTN